MHLICVCAYACITYTIWLLQHSLGITVGCGSMGISLCNYGALIEERQTEEPKLKVTRSIKTINFNLVFFLHSVHHSAA